MVVWTLRFTSIVAAAPLSRIPPARRRVAMLAAAILSLGVLGGTISAGKRPRMAWSKYFYGLRVPLER
jgi:hypothetical protein